MIYLKLTGVMGVAHNILRASKCQVCIPPMQEKTTMELERRYRCDFPHEPTIIR